MAKYSTLLKWYESPSSDINQVVNYLERRLAKELASSPEGVEKVYAGVVPYSKWSSEYSDDLPSYGLWGVIHGCSLERTSIHKRLWLTKTSVVFYGSNNEPVFRSVVEKHYSDRPNEAVTSQEGPRILEDLSKEISLYNEGRAAAIKALDAQMDAIQKDIDFLKDSEESIRKRLDSLYT